MQEEGGYQLRCAVCQKSVQVEVNFFLHIYSIQEAGLDNCTGGSLGERARVNQGSRQGKGQLGTYLLGNSWEM